MASPVSSLLLPTTARRCDHERGTGSAPERESGQHRRPPFFPRKTHVSTLIQPPTPDRVRGIREGHAPEPLQSGNNLLRSSPDRAVGRLPPDLLRRELRRGSLEQSGAPPNRSPRPKDGHGRGSTLLDRAQGRAISPAGRAAFSYFRTLRERRRRLVVCDRRRVERNRATASVAPERDQKAAAFSLLQRAFAMGVAPVSQLETSRRKSGRPTERSAKFGSCRPTADFPRPSFPAETTRKRSCRASLPPESAGKNPPRPNPRPPGEAAARPGDGHQHFPQAPVVLAEAPPGPVPAWPTRRIPSAGR